MPFPPASRTPASLASIKIALIDNDGVPANMRAHYYVQVLDSSGNVIDFPGMSGDLKNHLTTAQINALVAFMQDMRTKAENEFLT